MKRPLILVAVFFATYTLRCGGSDTSDLPPIIYEGSASDEAFERIWDKIPEATTSAMEAAALTEPMAAAELPAATPATFRWTLDNGGGQLTPADAPRFARKSWGLIAEAEAHLPPVTGDVFLLELRISGDSAEPIRVLTTKTEWTADADSWARLTGGSGMVSAQIWNAYLNQNVVEEGPFTAGAVQFRVAKP